MTLTSRLEAPKSSYKSCISAGGAFSVPYSYACLKVRAEDVQGKKSLPSPLLLYSGILLSCLPHTRYLKNMV